MFSENKYNVTSPVESVKYQSPSQRASTAQEPEVIVLRRRLRYLQTVSTVFRQKVSLLLRECSNAFPSSGDTNATSELQKWYKTALAEVSKAEGDIPEMSDLDLSALNGGGVQDQLLPVNKQKGSTVTPPYQRTEESKESIRKAHHLCVILQEKNDAKAKEFALGVKLEALQKEHTALLQKFNRLLDTQGTGTGAAAAVRELYEKRVHELEQQLIKARTEAVLRSNISGGLVNGRRAASSAIKSTVEEDDNDEEYALYIVPDVEDNAMIIPPQKIQPHQHSHEAFVALQKQNVLLKQRIARLKEDIAFVGQSSNNKELNLGMDALLLRVKQAHVQLGERDFQIQNVMAEKADVTRDLQDARKRLEQYIVQLDSLTVESSSWQATNAQQRASHNNEMQALTTALDDYGEQLSQRDKYISSLQEKLRDTNRTNSEQQLEMQALGSQMETFRARMETQAAGAEQQRLQQHLVDDVEQRLLSAVTELHKIQSTSTMTTQLEELNKKLKSLEGVELQLRQKDDLLTIAQDEVHRLRHSRDELHNALSSISSLFTVLPSSIPELEKLVVELEEHKKEVQHCAAHHVEPDVQKLEATIDLRLLRASAQKQEAAIRSGKGSGVSKRGATTTAAATGTMASSIASLLGDTSLVDRGGHDMDAEEDDIYSALLSKSTTINKPIATTTRKNMDSIMLRTATSSNAQPVAAEEDPDSKSNSFFEELFKVPPMPKSLVPWKNSSEQKNVLQEKCVGGGVSLLLTTPVDKQSIITKSTPQTPISRSGGGIHQSSDQLGNSNIKGVQEADIILTFHLFDDTGTGILSASTLRLCLATLGISLSIPKNVTEMKLEEFVAFCM